MNEQGLEPCPFCGEQERIQVDKLEGLILAVTCDGCGAQGPVEMTETEAVRQWNKRAKQ